MIEHVTCALLTILGLVHWIKFARMITDSSLCAFLSTLWRCYNFEMLKTHTYTYLGTHSNPNSFYTMPTFSWIVRKGNEDMTNIFGSYDIWTKWPYLSLWDVYPSIFRVLTTPHPCITLLISHVLQRCCSQFIHRSYYIWNSTSLCLDNVYTGLAKNFDNAMSYAAYVLIIFFLLFFQGKYRGKYILS